MPSGTPTSPPCAALVCGTQMLDERPYARRPAVLPTVECANGHRLGFPARQHEPQRTALELLGSNILGGRRAW